jgi:hypothetical protein
VTVVLAVVIFVVALAALEEPLFTVPTLTQPVEFPETSKRMDLQRLTGMYETVESLSVSAEDTVLVAFEYGPAEADELNLVAEPVLRHLLDRGAHISVASTRPEGGAVAHGLLDGIIKSGDQYTEMEYSPLGYRTGDAAGVSQLLADASPTLVVVLTAHPGPLRWWIEQAYAQGAGAIPIVAGVSAALEPAASPYLDVSAGQLAGAVRGLSGAAVYEGMRGAPGAATRRLNALAVGHIAIVILMIAGAAFHAPDSLRRRKK